MKYGVNLLYKSSNLTIMKTYTHWKHTLYICIYCILCSCCIYAQGSTGQKVRDVKAASKNSIKDIKPIIEDLDSKKAEELLDEYKSASKTLYTKLEKAEMQNTGNIEYYEYISVMQDANEYLDKLAKENTTDSEEYIEAFNAMVKDYNTKINTMDAAVANSFAKIEVKVHAKSGQDVLQGYDVTCDYVWDASTPIHRFKSNNQTDNASLSLAPGWYIIYISKDGAITKQREVNIQYNDDPDKIEEIIFIL